MKPVRESTANHNPLSQPTLTIEQAAEILQISRGSAYAAAREGTIPTIRVGRRLVVPTARFLRWLEGTG